MNSLNLYHIFYTVAQCGNISAAARKLYISQPAVSKSVSRLEESFSSPLLVRSSRGVTLTENGRLLYKTAFQAIRQGEEMISRNDLLGAGSLSMGVSATLCKYVLLPYLQDYIAENPYVKISLSCQSTHETITALENGALELGLVGESERLEGSRLNFLPIREIHDIFVCSPDYLGKLHTRPKEDFQQAGNLSAAEQRQCNPPIYRQAYASAGYLRGTQDRGVHHGPAHRLCPYRSWDRLRYRRVCPGRTAKRLSDGMFHQRADPSAPHWFCLPQICQTFRRHERFSGAAGLRKFSGNMNSK